MGEELEAQAPRTAAVAAKLAQRHEDLRDRWAAISRRQDDIITKKNVRRAKAGVEPFADPGVALTTTPEWIKLTAEGKRLRLEGIHVKKRLATSSIRNARHFEGGRRRMRRIVARPEATRTTGKFTVGTSDPELRARRLQGISDFQELVSDRWLRGRTVKVLSTTQNRSFAEMDGRIVRISGYAREESVVHELAHALELNHPEVLQSALRFYDRRTAGEALKFHVGEAGRPDAFIDAYIGRDYERLATEVISMGVEYMARNPLEFWRKDRDHFEFIWAILRGQIPQ